MRTHILLSCAFLLPTACLSDVPIASVGDPVAVTRLRSEPTAFEQYSTIEKGEVGVAGTQSEWDALYQRARGTRSPSQAAPQLNFADSTIVYAAIGMYLEGGHDVLIDSATADGSGKLTIFYTETAIDPATFCGTAQVVVRPVDVAQVMHWNGAVAFRRRARLVSC